jgi:hypothetical protein
MAAVLRSHPGDRMLLQDCAVVWRAQLETFGSAVDTVSFAPLAPWLMTVPCST